ncbi:DUF1289 domain-containing protein [Amphritea pacifica]|uniref:DUF1289 domain-containing protein n=1 Tax=Amphritea pacifica TaxID=2811233 RepID=A0ABS2W6X7_9GAMM|nr:DUF1289 domain-containing protein [Amphritea pacifica]MBN0987267.1 DUF1289 domain-containing protein [Amphritea pacifica]
MKTSHLHLSAANAHRLASPCIRNCCLDSDDICMGCYRTLNEILIWHSATEDEKRKILALCATRRQNRLNR